MRLRLITIALLLSSHSAFAETEAHEVDPHLIPWGTIGVEAFNFILLFGLLTYFLRKTVVEHFESRRRAYVELVDRAENAKAEALRSHKEISNRLESLQSSAALGLQQAQVEAAELKARLIKEAELLAKRMEEDAHRTADLEIERAKGELRAELLKSAIESSRDALKKTLGNSDQKRLQTEFMDKIQLVGQ